MSMALCFAKQPGRRPCKGRLIELSLFAADMKIGKKKLDFSVIIIYKLCLALQRLLSTYVSCWLASLYAECMYQ